MTDSDAVTDAVTDETGDGSAGEASSGTAEPTAESNPEPNPERPSRVQQLEHEGDVAADYLEELLDIADVDGDIDLDVEGERASVSVVGNGLDHLVGDDGRVLEAMQELTRLAVYRETGQRSRLMLDIGGYRAELRRNLEELAKDAIDEVKQSGEPAKLAPMSPFERKVVHDAVADAGLTSESEGAEPTRCVVIVPAS